MELVTVPCGELLSPGWRKAVEELFRSCYHQYHYLKHFTSADRDRFLAVTNGQVVGYATARTTASNVLLANLLIHPHERGRGLGRRLEELRCGQARASGLPLYTSCTCDDGSSQRLKIALGMHPIAVRIGYRRDVVRPGSWGSSVVFTDTKVAVGKPPQERISEDTARGRLRWIGADPLAAVPDLVRHTNGYADIMTGEAGAALLFGDERVRYAGLDLDLSSGIWLKCFQIGNSAYSSGLAEQPVVVLAPNGVRLGPPTVVAA